MVWLDAGAAYTYSAYSDDGCTDANLLATADAFTTMVSVGNLAKAMDGWEDGYELRSVSAEFRAKAGKP